LAEVGSTKGKSGKFFTERIQAGKKKLPEKWQKYPRKTLHGRSKKGRRDYPWRKKKKR
jgi:hypothetical protein